MRFCVATPHFIASPRQKDNLVRPENNFQYTYCDIYGSSECKNAEPWRRTWYFCFPNFLHPARKLRPPTSCLPLWQLAASWQPRFMRQLHHCLKILAASLKAIQKTVILQQTGTQQKHGWSNQSAWCPHKPHAYNNQSKVNIAFWCVNGSTQLNSLSDGSRSTEKHKLHKLHKSAHVRFTATCSSSIKRGRNSCKDKMIRKQKHARTLQKYKQEGVCSLKKDVHS